MPEYRRPSLLTADLVEVSTHLLGKNIKASITYDDTAMLITIDGTSADLNAALTDYTPTAVRGEYRPPPTPLDMLTTALNPDGTIPAAAIEDAVLAIVPTIEGPQGIPGTPGIQGIQGTNGTNGTQGIQGIQGPAVVPVYANLAGATALALAINDVVKVTPTATGTLTSTVPAAGHQRAVILLQSNTTAKTITFGTGFKPVSTLALGTVASRVFVVSFVSDGTNLYERSRTAAMVA